MHRLFLFWLVMAVGCGDDSGTSPNNQTTSSNNQTTSSNNATSSSNNATNTSTNNVTNATNNQTTPTNNATNNQTNGPDCVPSEAAFATIQPFLQEGCQTCHGATPTFGAPMPLVDYSAMVAGAEGERVVDKMVARLVNKTMPPANAPPLTHQGLDTLTEWASCGMAHPDHTIGLNANKPPLTAPAQAPNLPSFDVTASDYALGQNELDRYQCFVVRTPLNERRIIRRIEPVIDDARVVHHFLVKLQSGNPAETSFACPGFPPGDSYAYVWGPGQAPLQFPDGGIVMEPGDAFVLQIHYNNGAGAANVRDSSGIRVYHDAVAGPEYALAEIGPGVGFPSIPAGQTGSSSQDCTVNTDVSLFATWPHMHEIGSAFDQSVRRSGTNAIESIIALAGWAFEAQIIYDTPMALNAGDRISTGCEWENTKNFTVFPGLGSSDEMCFSFMYVTPPIEGFCN
ncbi:MAG: hypothetical protein R3E66_22505 [bacterium]